ncbi:unnamed protein product [Amoebophrya sp. A120]|nr:unnamed protein product [Amoebophrya sp. A120]|eukprot:GSA120T00019955001.1
MREIKEQAVVQEFKQQVTAKLKQRRPPEAPRPLVRRQRVDPLVRANEKRKLIDGVRDLVLPRYITFTKDEKLLVKVPLKDDQGEMWHPTKTLKPEAYGSPGAALAQAIEYRDEFISTRDQQISRLKRQRAAREAARADPQ